MRLFSVQRIGIYRYSFTAFLWFYDLLIKDYLGLSYVVHKVNSLGTCSIQFFPGCIFVNCLTTNFQPLIAESSFKRNLKLPKNIDLLGIKSLLSTTALAQSFLYLYSQSHSIWQVFVSLDRHDVLLWHRHGGPVPGARPGRDQPQRHQKGRRRTLPQIPHGNTINDSIKPPPRRRRQGRFHQMALHDITHLGRISHRKMDPWGRQALAASHFA